MPSVRPFSDHRLFGQDYCDLICGSAIIGIGVWIWATEGSRGIWLFVLFALAGSTLLLAGWLGSTEAGHLDARNERTYFLKRRLRITVYLAVLFLFVLVPRCAEMLDAVA